MRRRAFTLVEMLVVVAVLGLLAALLFPIFSRARERARRTACASNLRQIGLGILQYRADWEGLPDHLSAASPSYINSPQLFHCPSDVAEGQFTGGDRLEGTLYLSSGVSYEYFPQWHDAQVVGWYNPAPNFGPGKWDDLTPLAGCAWHWAKSFDAAQVGNKISAGGWEVIVTLGGSVRRARAEELPDGFTPDKYH